MGYSSYRGAVGAQCAENTICLGAQCTENKILLGAQCVECVSMGWNTHALSDTHQGGNVSVSSFLQLKNELLVGKARLFLVPARQMDKK
jgi:hypothetical protein